MAAKNIILLLAMQIALIKCTSLTESNEDMTKRYRLPNTVVPKKYSISIEPDMDGERFSWIGESTITIEVLKVTNIITLHRYINLVMHGHETFLGAMDGSRKTYKPLHHNRDNELEILKIEFDENIPIGSYTLFLKYKGWDYEHGRGFYKISNENRQSCKNVAVSNFEPTMARRAFPCWDEPGLKAIFQISIKHDSKYTAISNMPAFQRKKLLNGKTLTKFIKTSKMSTYLLNIGIGDYIETSNQHNNVTVWACKTAETEASYYLKNYDKAIQIMEPYMGLSFDLPKMGLALTTSSYHDAVYNWGAGNFDSKKRDWIDTMIAHEVARSWFGNRVSPVWWNDVWLYEAFVQYLNYFILDKMHGNGGALKRLMMTDNQRDSLFYDENEEHPLIRGEPMTNSEIANVFHHNAQVKGASIVHMIRSILTDEIFQAGIRKFLTKHSFKTAGTKDLLREFQEAFDENNNSRVRVNVEEVMMPWLTQTGYPMINVLRDYVTRNTEVSQRSFIGGDSSSKSWQIPLNYATKTNPNFASTVPSQWLGDNDDSVVIGGIKKDDWVIFNVQASGYFRVNYDDTNWRRIADYLNTTSYKNIDVLNRAQLIDDTLYIWKQNVTRYAD